MIESRKYLEPNTILYTTILKGYAKAKDLNKSLEILEIMK